MTFLAMLLAVVLLQLWGSGQRVQRDSWFIDWVDFLGRFGIAAGPRAVVAWACPVVLVSLMLALLDDMLFGLLWLVAATVLLLYSFGRGDFQALLERYRDYLQRGDTEAAAIAAARDFARAGDLREPDTAAALGQQIRAGLLYEGFQRWFAVLFFFLLLGPAGAFGYRLLHLLREHAGDCGADTVCHVADWLPARLLGATFCLTGDFTASRDALLDTLGDAERRAGNLLEHIATAAVNVADSVDSGQLAAQIEAIRALLSRSAAAWLVVISLTVILF